MESQKGFASIGIIILVLLVGAVGYFVWQNQNLSNQVVQPTPTSTPTQTSQATNCENKNLDIGVGLPNTNWSCTSSDEGFSILILKNDIFTINISDAGRGQYCDLRANSESPNACVITPFYSNELLNLELFTSYGENKEIFGEIKAGNVHPLIAIKYEDMESRDLSELEKAELINLLDSIKPIE